TLMTWKAVVSSLSRRTHSLAAMKDASTVFLFSIVSPVSENIIKSENSKIISLKPMFHRKVKLAFFVKMAWKPAVEKWIQQEENKTDGRTTEGAENLFILNL